MNKYEIVKKREDFAPLETQEAWDASGWVVDTASPEVNKIMFALTVTDYIVDQARRNDCDMIISHHPLFYVPYKYSGINIYCAHTNMDKAKGGTTDLLVKALCEEAYPCGDYVRIVELPREVSVEFMKIRLLPLSPRLRVVNNHKVKTIKTVAFCAGSGSEFIKDVPCDAFVTGDLKYHTAIESNKVIFDIGHFESEIFVVKFLKELTEVGVKGVIAHEESPFS